MNTKRLSGGFTIIELLVVVLILSILMSVALPLYLTTEQNAEKRTCRANQQTIASAILANRLNKGYSNFANYIGKAVNSTNEPDLTSPPICPNQGTYTITNGNSNSNTTFKVNCNVAVHGSFQPGVDSQ